MNIAVYGMWHLGCVTAACVAKAGHKVVAIADNEDACMELRYGRAPLQEPGLDDLLKEGIRLNNIIFESNLSEIKNAEILWVTFDTPVDDNDIADVEYVENKIKEAIPYLKDHAVILISSQVPVGTCKRLEEFLERGIRIAYSPENLRLGKALDVFQNSDRVIIGVPNDLVLDSLMELFAPFTEKMEFMSVASAEMTKHAINTFLAMSVVFANEIARICENSGADMREVERGLKTESRIGPKAYVRAGEAFAGGTLARDVRFLDGMDSNGTFFQSILESNDHHKHWVQRKLHEVLKDIKDKRVAVLGLSYKEGSDTLRRSAGITLCHWIRGKGGESIGHDPLIDEHHKELEGTLVTTNLEGVLRCTDAIVIMRGWDGLGTALKDAKTHAHVIDLTGNYGDLKFKNYYRVGLGK